MLEIAIIGAIVGLVVFMAGRSLFRTMTGKVKSRCCGCTKCLCDHGEKEDIMPWQSIQDRNKSINGKN